MPIMEFSGLLELSLENRTNNINHLRSEERSPRGPLIYNSPLNPHLRLNIYDEGPMQGVVNVEMEELRL